MAVSLVSEASAPMKSVYKQNTGKKQKRAVFDLFQIWFLLVRGFRKGVKLGRDEKGYEHRLFRKN